MFFFSLLLLVLIATSSWAETPKLFREKPVTCGALAEAVNYFVDLGEERAIKELESLTLDWTTDFKDNISRNERIGWVCRILFKPKGKDPLRAPRFGGHMLPRISMPLTKWPLYPIAASGSTYIVLSEGYLLGGLPEDPKDYLNYCRKQGRFRMECVPVPTKLQALKDLEQLRQSEAWKAIKWEDSDPGISYTFSEDWIWGFIKAQAENMPAK